MGNTPSFICLVALLLCSQPALSQQNGVELDAPSDPAADGVQQEQPTGTWTTHFAGQCPTPSSMLNPGVQEPDVTVEQFEQTQTITAATMSIMTSLSGGRYSMDGIQREISVAYLQSGCSPEIVGRISDRHHQAFQLGDSIYSVVGVPLPAGTSPEIAGVSKFDPNIGTMLFIPQPEGDRQQICDDARTLTGADNCDRVIEMENQIISGNYTSEDFCRDFLALPPGSDEVAVAGIVVEGLKILVPVVLGVLANEVYQSTKPPPGYSVLQATETRLKEDLAGLEGQRVRLGDERDREIDRITPLVEQSPESGSTSDAADSTTAAEIETSKNEVQRLDKEIKEVDDNISDTQKELDATRREMRALLNPDKEDFVQECALSMAAQEGLREFRREVSEQRMICQAGGIDPTVTSEDVADNNITPAGRQSLVPGQKPVFIPPQIQSGFGATCDLSSLGERLSHWTAELDRPINQVVLERRGQAIQWERDQRRLGASCNCGENELCRWDNENEVYNCETLEAAYQDRLGTILQNLAQEFGGTGSSPLVCNDLARAQSMMIGSSLSCN